LMALYQLWLARNEARDKPMIEDPVVTARRTVALVEEWQAITSTPNQSSARVVERWSPPLQEWVKVNSDGAFSQGSGHGGGGVVMRDHHGSFLAGSSCFFPQVTDPEHAELLACRAAIQLATDRGVSKLMLESDYQAAVRKIATTELDRSMHGPLVEDIKALLGDFEEFTVSFVRRTGNGVAHVFAKLGYDDKCCNTWVDFPPGCVVDLLASDAGF
jgi:ribonuclease HI